MKKALLATLAASALTMAAAAAHGATITVVTSLAPNVYGSPNWGTYQANAMTALDLGLSSYGAPGTPGYYQTTTNVRADQAIVTGFPSWMGQVDPGTVFGSQYANEYGNRMHFGVRIDGNGQQISIDQLSFSASSSDAGDLLGFGYGAGSYGYSSAYEGVLAGADGVLWTADDVFITGGPSNQLVDGIIGRGSGNSDAAYCSGCTLAQQQAALDTEARYFTSPTTFVGTYSLGADSGSGTFNISPVPEPRTWVMMLLGVFGLGALLRRRRPAARPRLAFG